LLVNPALEKHFGLKRSAAEGSYFWECFRDADINRMFEKGLQARVVAKEEHAVSLSPSVFEIQVSPVFSKGEFLGVVAVFRDITLLKEFERLRTEFVANVSHELKTPLTSILGFVETLKEGGMDDRDNRLKFLQIIEDQSMKLYALIEDLLLLSKMESAAEPLRLEEVSVEKLFDKMKETFSPLLKEKRIQWKTVTPDKPLKIHAEAASLERALSNLIDNALKYNRPDGQVTLEASSRHAEAVLQVGDSGPGISPTDLPRIFERFYRSEKSRSRESGGTGLGLSIAKHIVERHGGRIEVRSAPGRGSVFSIILPS
jgi:two-component system phosphate regulon sensor histidine kinase PhoR